METKWVHMSCYSLRSAGLKGLQWFRPKRKMETTWLRYECASFQRRHAPCRKYVGICFYFIFLLNLSRLLFEWFTAKRNALWISLRFNLSQRPLKSGSNALISYSGERLIYRYACHLLLPIFINNKASRCHWCLNQKLHCDTSPSWRLLSGREFAKWSQYISRSNGFYTSRKLTTRAAGNWCEQSADECSVRWV